MPVVIAVPHAGRAYSDDIIGRMRDPLQGASRLEDRHTDSLALAVAERVEVPVLIAQTPRAVIDLNRAEDDIDWGMIAGGKSREARHSLANRRARSGLGLVPRRLPVTGEIWRGPMTREELDSRIASVHQPYHRRLGQLLEAQRHRWGAAVLIDLHSMPPLPAPAPGERGAQLVVGDRFGASCDAALSAEAVRCLAARGHLVAHNRPYAGGHVLERHGHPRRGIHALQLEVCRSTYLDDSLDLPALGMTAMAATIAALVRALSDVAATLGRGQAYAQAAE